VVLLNEKACSLYRQAGTMEENLFSLDCTCIIPHSEFTRRCNWILSTRQSRTTTSFLVSSDRLLDPLSPTTCSLDIEIIEHRTLVIIQIKNGTLNSSGYTTFFHGIRTLSTNKNRVAGILQIYKLGQDGETNDESASQASLSRSNTVTKLMRYEQDGIKTEKKKEE